MLRFQLDGIMTLEAEAGNALDQQPFCIGAMRVMAGNAIAVSHRFMQGPVGKLLFELLVTAETEIFAGRGQQTFVTCGVGGMTGHAASFHQRFMLELPFENIRFIAMTEKTESGAFSHQKLVRRSRVGVMAGDTISLLHRLMNNSSLDNTFLVVALKTELFLGNVQNDTAYRAARGVTGITASILERLVNLALQQFFVCGGMRIMAGSAI